MPNFRLETCLIRADGSSFWCQVNSTLFPDEGGELGYTILEDITERKELEETNKRLYDAQETILHLVAHDLRGPFATIELLTDLLEGIYLSQSPKTPHRTPRATSPSSSGHVPRAKRCCGICSTSPPSRPTG